MISSTLVTYKLKNHGFFCFLVFLLKRCRDMNFFLRPKQLASAAIVPVNEFPNRIVCDKCTGACQL